MARRWVVALLAAVLLPLAQTPYAVAQRPSSVRVMDQAKPAPLLHARPRHATHLLDWKRVGYPRSATIWTNGTWILAMSNEVDRWVELTGPGFARHWDVPDKNYYVDSTFLDDRWAVFGVNHQTRDKQSPPVYRAVDLATGRTEIIDQSLTGKALWADDYLAGRLLVSVRRSGQWCLGYVDLGTRTLSDGPCPEPGHYFDAARLTDVGLSAGEFDPSAPLGDRAFTCVDQLDLRSDPPVRFLGTGRCWPRKDAMLVPHGYLWSQVTAVGKIAPSRLYAVAGNTRYRLGRGGAAVWCDGAAYLAIDGRLDHYGPRIARWDGNGVLTTVYQAPLGKPGLGWVRCGGDHLVLSTGDLGSPQLSASLR